MTLNQNILEISKQKTNSLQLTYNSTYNCMLACNHTIAAAHNIIISIDHLIDGRYSDHACGVRGASCRVLGRIPANTVSFIIAGHGESEGCVIEKSPAIACSGAKIAIRLKCY